MSNNDKVTSTDIKKALAEYYSKDYFITECKTCSTYFPDPQGLLKFDGLAIRKSYTGPCITGHEIKVSRGDFLQDSKWHLYLQYCNEFYFVVPAGLIDKGELPDNVGLIYYYPKTGTLKKRKKALWRDIEEPVGVYKYIIFSRLDQDRTPFYESRAEYAKDYLKDKSEKRKLGKQFGSKIANDLIEAQVRLAVLQKTEEKIKLLDQLKEVMKKHDVGLYCWKDDELVKELDKALQSHYPRDLDRVRMYLQNAIDRLDVIEKECGGEMDNQGAEDESS